jgi:hypothetical protein
MKNSIKYNRKYYKNNKDRFTLYRIKYRLKIKKYNKQYKKNHKKEQKNYNKEYYIKNRKRLILVAKQNNRKRNKLLIEYRKQYYIKNKDIINKKEQTKYYSNINFRLAKRLRIRIWSAIQNNIKSKSTINLLGCSIDKLKNHLSSQFKSGMFWSNYGKWHIDHIKPCASFDLSKPEEQRKCFHYKNLQPLWAKDNLRKGKKYE